MIEFPLAKHADPMIQEAPVPQDGEEDAVKESPVGLREMVPPGVSLDQGVSVEIAFGPCSQGRNGSTADILIRHR